MLWKIISDSMEYFILLLAKWWARVVVLSVNVLVSQRRLWKWFKLRNLAVSSRMKTTFLLRKIWHFFVCVSVGSSKASSQIIKLKGVFTDALHANPLSRFVRENYLTFLFQGSWLNYKQTVHIHVGAMRRNCSIWYDFKNNFLLT